MHSSAWLPSQKTAWIIPTNFSQCVGAGDFSLVAACNQYWRFSDLILFGIPYLFCPRRQTDQATTSSSGMPSSTRNIVHSTGMLRPGWGTLHYNPTLSSVIRLMVTLDGGWGGWSLISRYHPRI